MRSFAFILMYFFLPASFLIGQDTGEVGDSLARVQLRENVLKYFNSRLFIEMTGYQKQDSTRIDTIFIDHRKEMIRVMLDDRLAYAPFREKSVLYFETGMKDGLQPPFNDYAMEIRSAGRNIREYIPNYYRSDRRDKDRERAVGRLRRRPPPLVRNLSRPYLDDACLYHTNIALWHSHGWYYEPELNRWEWQRARIFETVEDIFPMAFTLPMLVPMLENAGASVFLPRERDWQQHEVIVDNDGSTGSSVFFSTEHVGSSPAGTGFGIGQPPYVNENPFQLGSFCTMESDRNSSESVIWIPDIPGEGHYAVYVSYHASPNNADDVKYSVYHAGGRTDFSVNQQMGGGTWIYLGKFKFLRGIHEARGKVVLTNESRNRSARITADAVRFGGGTGNISRNGLTSNRPRYQESARYYLQYAGFPDTLVWKLNTPADDYADDYQSRGEWVNYLIGAPYGPSADRGAAGLGIPVDLSFAFHTDAGISSGDTVIGTLGIYSTSPDEGYFPGGLSRMASRDLTDLIQSQIVEDIRAGYDSDWVRRAMWDRNYSEAYRPNVPAMLLELLSHQNLIDMRFGNEPMFRFDVSRAIYKGMLRFLCELYGMEAVVQPLPVRSFRTEFNEQGGITLHWQPQEDPLEPSAVPGSYRVYTRINGGGFDNGQTVEGTDFTLDEYASDSIYSFRITAVNGGGESFPSEVLSVCRRTGSRGTVLLVSAFDRTGGQAYFDDEQYSGFLHMVDQGVPFRDNLHTVGAQYDFRKSSPWLDDDSPGHGASYADLEQKIFPGNTFDFSYVHGVSVGAAGYSFVSVSDETVSRGGVDLKRYDAVDLIFGEEKSTYMPKNDTTVWFRVFPDSLLRVLSDYLGEEGNVFISGAHIASDPHSHGQDSLVASLLKYTWRTSNASRLGKFYFMDPGFSDISDRYVFNTFHHPHVYTVEG
ncbi:MAG: xanthan lyase, partial [Bacteroidales bacterium]